MRSIAIRYRKIMPRMMDARHYHAEELESMDLDLACVAGGGHLVPS